MDDLPFGLIFLDCDKNKITSLKNLPKTLNQLSCSNTGAELDNLPKLNKLYTDNVKAVKDNIKDNVKDDVKNLIKIINK